MEVSTLRQVTMEKGGKKTKWVLKLKFGVSWTAIRKAASSTMKRHRFHLTCASSIKQLSPVRVHQEAALKPIPHAKKTKKNVRNGTKSLAYLLNLPYTASDFIDRGDQMTPTKSPKENISAKWHEIQGLLNWESLIDPLQPWLRCEVIKYGEFVQATYDAFDFDPLSEYCGSCRYNRHKLFEELGLTKNGYKVTKYISAMPHVDVPQWLERSHLGETWSKDSNWMGYVAVSNNEESKRIGRRDIVMAWRGTVAPTEWFTDLKAKLESIGNGNIKVQHGFLSIYKTKSEFTRYNKLSASEQVMQEVNRLIEFYKGEEISFTITGHSLGGALALLNAYEAATLIPGLPISVISFGAPRVGNMAFKDKLTEMKVKTLRIVVKQDIVPKVPGIIFNNILHKLNFVTQKFNWVYRHVGTQLELDVFTSPYLKHESDLLGCHNLELYLHLLDGFLSKQSKFRWNARRDVALVNKTSDMLIEELRIPEFWYELPYKGLVLNKYGRWVKPSREAEDIPSPFSVASEHESALIH
ncbi:phospholipase A1-Igamma1, chloroplastic-like [Fagus crenata]